MNVEMCPVEIIGLKTKLQDILHILRRLGCVQIEELREFSAIMARPLTLNRETLRTQEETSVLLARLEGLIEALGCAHTQKKLVPMEDYLVEARACTEQLVPQVQALASRCEKLQTEQAMFPRYEATLRKLLPIIPSSAHKPGNVSVGILVSRVHVGVLDSVGNQVLQLTSGRADIVASDVDASTRAMLIVFPQEFTSEIEALLGQEDVSRLRLPSELGSGPPDVVLSTLHQRMLAIPKEIEAINKEMDRLSAQWCDRLLTIRDALRDELDANSVLSRFGETDMTFILVGWVPARNFEQVKMALMDEVGEAVLVEKLPLTPELKERAPVILQNPRPAQPFESLVKLLSLPRYGHIDPTRLMALFLPIFFGMILGDVGYGALLLAISLWLLLTRFKTGIVRDILIILAMGSSWAILFGFLYGELFGSLGEHIGMHAIWIDRASADQVAGLLLMALVVGAVHITLGLILGVWEAIQERSRNHLLERGGMLLGLICLFLIVGVLTNYLPKGFMTPAIGGMIVGIALLGAPLGWLGLLIGPIEFIGLIGNVLSYLRIAAIGLASVYLAKVANDMIGMLGNIIVGVIIALLIHALNLILGGFSPTIHSLRLHYVEFFRKFYEGGGRPYEPFKSRF